MIFVQNLQTVSEETDRDGEKENFFFIACSCLGWEGYLHLMFMLGAVCDSLEQPKEGCGG